MSKILKVIEAIKIAKKLRKQNKSIVLAGGCFDILHIGHIKFLENSKKCGDVLFVFLESDKAVRRLKGYNRPINNQENRAIVLSALSSVDFVVMLTNLKKDCEYDKIITKIHPSIIATTPNDSNIIHKKRQAKLIDGKVMYVAKRISDQSTTKIASLATEEIL